MVETHKYKMAYVEWEDTELLAGWHNYDSVQKYCTQNGSLFKSVGWLVKNDDTAVVLAMSIGRYKAGDLLRIPAKMVKEVLVVAPPDEVGE
jgi:hypothetical protein